MNPFNVPQVGKLTVERDMLQSNIAELRERQGAARKEVEEVRRQLRDSEAARREAEDRVLRLQQGTDKTKVIITMVTLGGLIPVNLHNW